MSYNSLCYGRWLPTFQDQIFHLFNTDEICSSLSCCTWPCKS